MEGEACVCTCEECKAGTCAVCSHKDSAEGCACAGCTCNMDIQPEAPMETSM